MTVTTVFLLLSPFESDAPRSIHATLEGAQKAAEMPGIQWKRTCCDVWEVTAESGWKLEIQEWVVE